MFNWIDKKTQLLTKKVLHGCPRRLRAPALELFRQQSSLGKISRETFAAFKTTWIGRTLFPFIQEASQQMVHYQAMQSEFLLSPLNIRDANHSANATNHTLRTPRRFDIPPVSDHLADPVSAHGPHIFPAFQNQLWLPPARFSRPDSPPESQMSPYQSAV